MTRDRIADENITRTSAGAPWTGTSFISERLYTSVQCRGWPARAAVSDVMHLRVRCPNPRCDRIEVFDASWWVRGCGANDRLHMLEDRMRCTACGGRSARFEVWSGPQPPKAAGAWPRIYQFF